MGDLPHDLERANRAYDERAWLDACEAFARADDHEALEAADLERWATASGLVGDDAGLVARYERVYAAVESSDPARAAMAAFWIAARLFVHGEVAKASGWLTRAKQRADEKSEGYVQIGAVVERLAARDLEGAASAALAAAESGERHGDRDLVALGRNYLGRVRLRQGHFAEGLALLDETMLAASEDRISPFVTGLVYCGAITGCRSVWALDRAREWTSALDEWRESQPQLGPFSGACSVMRAELLELGGSWDLASESLEKIAELHGESVIGADARYHEGELHRLRGDHSRAEGAYRASSALGRDPQPGLALLRLAQGQIEPAFTSIHRATDSLWDPLDRLRLLPALVEIAIAANRLDEARKAHAELEAVAKTCESAALRAIANEAHGQLLFANGEVAAALRLFRAAFETWQRVDAPYRAACLRRATARACRALGDVEGAELEERGARATFEKLGASVKEDAGHGLSAREVQVLRLIATGKTNKEIASSLVLSVKTIDRHLSNIFSKIGVNSRSGATAFAFKSGVMGNSTHA